MASREELVGLLERVKAATGPDREIDFSVARWLGWTQHTDEDDPVYRGAVSTWWAEPGVQWSTCSHPPQWTRSVDAALELVDWMLPGWPTRHHTAVSMPPIRWHFYIDRHCADRGGVHGPHEFCGVGRPPLAILAALLTALLAKGASHA